MPSARRYRWPFLAAETRVGGRRFSGPGAACVSRGRIRQRTDRRTEPESGTEDRRRVCPANHEPDDSGRKQRSGGSRRQRRPLGNGRDHGGDCRRGPLDGARDHRHRTGERTLCGEGNRTHGRRGRYFLGQCRQHSAHRRTEVLGSGRTTFAGWLAGCHCRLAANRFQCGGDRSPHADLRTVKAILGYRRLPWRSPPGLSCPATAGLRVGLRTGTGRCLPGRIDPRRGLPGHSL